MSAVVVIASDPEIVEAAARAARDSDSHIDVFAELPPLPALEPADLVVLGSPAAEISFARRAMSRAPHAKVIVAASEGECDRLRQQLRFTAHGNRVDCVVSNGPAVASAVRSSVEQLRRRARFARTVGVLNQRIAASPPARASEAAALLGTLLDLAPIGVVITENDGCVREMNPFCERLLDIGEAEAGGNPVWDLFAAPDRSRARAFVNALARGETRAQDVFAAEGRTANLQIEVTGASLGPSSSVDGLLLLLQNITERTRLVSELRDANRRKDEFLAMLGHELRNPLAPIRTAVELLRLRGSPEIERERASIERQVNHLVQLVDDLLDVSRITRGKLQLKRERFELATAVAQAIEMASPLLEERRHTLHFETPRTGLAVDADRSRVAQIVANLVTNAAKYTDPSGTIEIVAKRERQWAVIEVRDTGRGVSAELLPHVFNLFVQERQNLDRAAGGLGLGLAIVRNLVEMQGGQVAVESEVGRGSTFTVRLPLSGDGEALELETATEEPAIAADTIDGRRVLVVDDNIDAANLLALILESFGFATSVAYDGPSALRVAREFHPDIAILDIGLPVMDGYEVAERLHAMTEFETLPLVAVTGYGQIEDHARSRAAGFAAHLTKPVAADALRRSIDEHCPPQTRH
jgi:signal transduction histidine kinase/ActR/RegA family two-component response regulator